MGRIKTVTLVFFHKDMIDINRGSFYSPIYLNKSYYPVYLRKMNFCQATHVWF